MTEETSTFEVRQSQFIDSRELNEGLPQIPYLYDSVGALITDEQSIRAIQEASDSEIPSSVKAFIMEHCTLFPEDEKLIAMRNSNYFSYVTQIGTRDEKINSSEVFDTLGGITNLIDEMSKSISQDKPAEEQKLALLCLLDHGKGIALKLLDNEFNTAQFKPAENYEPAVFLAQAYVDAYYSLLIDGVAPDSEEVISSYKLLNRQKLHNPSDPEKQKNAYGDWIREMDNPLLIVFQVNRICNEIEKGLQCDVVLTPFQGASEIGFALKARIKMRKKVPVPEIIPIKYGGKQARSGVTPKNLFTKGFDAVSAISRKHVWIVDDNIVTGNTQVMLSKMIAEQYDPADIKASVVQVSDGKIQEDLEPQLKKLLATRAVSATFAEYAVPEENIDIYRFRLPLEPALKQLAYGSS
ncbi:MAG: phosphoribosyltransferase [bacterium]|nr:phosphoribosyltransferase [bacterium]